MIKQRRLGAIKRAVLATPAIMVASALLTLYAAQKAQAFSPDATKPRIWTLAYPMTSSTQDATSLVQAAGGRVLVNWQPIHVVIAESDKPAFFDAIAAGVPGLRGSARLKVGRDQPPARINPPKPKKKLDANKPRPPFNPNDDWNMRFIRAPAARLHLAANPATHPFTPLIAIPDSAVDFTHPALRHAKAPNGSISCHSGVPESRTLKPTSSHGTKIAGVIAARQVNGKGVTGVAPNVKLLSIARGTGADNNLCAIMTAIDRHADVISMSFGIDDKTIEINTTSSLNQDLERRAVDYALQRGIVVTESVGNNGYDWGARPSTFLPRGGFTNGVIGVSALDKQGAKTKYSSFGLGIVGLTAPGGNSALGKLVTTGLNHTWTSASGTSFSAPQVAAAAALVKARHPDWTGAQITKQLKKTARYLPCPDTSDGRCVEKLDEIGRFNSFYGYGALDIEAAVKR